MSSIDRPLSGTALQFHLRTEIERVKDPAAATGHERHSRTLVKEGALRVTLISLRAGGHVAPHHADGPITVQVLEGDIELGVAGSDHRLLPGDLLVVDKGIEHEVRSQDGGTFLLTVVQPGS